MLYFNFIYFIYLVLIYKSYILFITFWLKHICYKPSIKIKLKHFTSISINYINLISQNWVFVNLSILVEYFRLISFSVTTFTAE